MFPLFNKKNQIPDRFDGFYDKDGYFIDAPYEDIDDNKSVRIKQTDYPKKSYRNQKRKDNYDTYDDSYDAYDDTYDTYDETYETFYEDKEHRSINIKVVTALCLYLFFLLLGLFNTTFADGYVPQIVNAKIKGQRVIYDKTMDVIEFLEELDDFKGLTELQELSKTRSFQERIPPLQSSLKKVTKEIESLQARAYKVKESDYLNMEMMYMANDLLTEEVSTLKAAILYYQELSGYASLNSEKVIQSQEELLARQNQYKTKLGNYKIRLEQIRVNDLLLFE